MDSDVVVAAFLAFEPMFTVFNLLFLRAQAGVRP